MKNIILSNMYDTPNLDHGCNSKSQQIVPFNHSITDNKTAYDPSLRTHLQ